MRTSGTRLNSTSRSSMRSTSRSTRPSHIPSKRSDTIATLVDSLTSIIGFHLHGDDWIIAFDDEIEDLCRKAEEAFRTMLREHQGRGSTQLHEVQCKVYPIQLDQVIFPLIDQIP